MHPSGKTIFSSHIKKLFRPNSSTLQLETSHAEIAIIKLCTQGLQFILEMRDVDILYQRKIDYSRTVLDLTIDYVHQSPFFHTECRFCQGPDPGRALNFYSGRGVRPRFLKCGACELIIASEKGVL